MTPERWRKVERIFHDALEAAPEKRDVFLNYACSGDALLRREVESLLASNEAAKQESFPKSPVNLDGLKQKSDRLIGETLDEKYRIEKLLGQGGMGAVYLAVHIGTDRPVAVKIISPQFMQQEEYVERFKREARAAGRLRHPNVVNVTDFGFARAGSGRIAYLVMEYLNGCTLGEMIEKCRRLPLRFVVDIVEQTCLAIDEAHKQGIIHRDLKPDNIWLEPDGRGGYNVKVLDFGLAKPFTEQSSKSASAIAGTSINKPSLGDFPDNSFADGRDDKKALTVETRAINLAIADSIDPSVASEWMSRASVVLGTPHYMSPEQCQGRPLDGRSDIYSLGVVVYETLSGEPPFSGDPYQLLEKHCNTSPLSLREKIPNIPIAVEQQVMRSLSKKPSKRHATATAFATALRMAVERESSILEQTSQLYRRHRSAFSKISLLIYSPVVIFVSLLLLVPAIFPSVNFRFFGLVQKLSWLFSLLLILVAGTINTAACAMVVERLRALSTNPMSIRIRDVFPIILERFGALAATALAGYRNFFSKQLRFVKPERSDYTDNSLYVPAVMLEGKRELEALQRSRDLSERISAVVLPLKLRNLFFGMTAALMFLFALLIGGLLSDWFKEFSALRWSAPIMAALIPVAFAVLFHPRIAIAFVLLYYKARQAGGEVIEESLNRNALPADLADDAETLRFHKMSDARIAASLIVLVIALAAWIAIKERALVYAASRGYANTVRTLMAAGADPSKASDSGLTAVEWASMKGFDDTVEVLSAAGVGMNTMQNMIAIPGGEFTMGRDPGMNEFGFNIPNDQTPKRPVKVNHFYIGKYEVTNREYKKFINAANYPVPPNWKDSVYVEGTADQPVTSVSWDDAVAYCKWRTEKEGKPYRLPTEEEWEYAARGPENLRYAWGNTWEHNRANTKNLAFAALIVTSETLARDRSPFGVIAMSGNVSEWTSSEYKPYPGNDKGIVKPCEPGDKAVRGSNYKSSNSSATATYRLCAPATLREAVCGFRIAMDAK